MLSDFVAETGLTIALSIWGTDGDYAHRTGHDNGHKSIKPSYSKVAFLHFTHDLSTQLGYEGGGPATSGAQNPTEEKREGLVGKHLREKRKFSMEINRADVAELVDARDLKFSAPAENKAVF